MGRAIDKAADLLLSAFFVLIVLIVLFLECFRLVFYPDRECPITGETAMLRRLADEWNASHPDGPWINFEDKVLVRNDKIHTYGRRKVLP